MGIASTAGETAQFLKGAVGFGVGDRIRKAYELLAADYEPGDEIYLFGFSRGAFEARSLGGLITLFGVAKSVKDLPFEKAWSLYRTRAARRERAALTRSGPPRTIRSHQVRWRVGHGRQHRQSVQLERPHQSHVQVP